MARKFFFALTYWFGIPPWDTGITPPEVYQFLEGNSPGRALDLGCGTGTNVITIAEYGWQVEGVDYVSRAVSAARRKAVRKGLGDKVKFRIGDVLSPDSYRDFYDLILDIGCFHSFSGVDVDRYIKAVSSHLAPNGSLLIYVHLSENSDSEHGASEASLTKLGEKLQLVKRVDGEESARPSAWLEFKKDPNHRADSE